MRQLSLALFFCMLLLAGFQAAHYYPLLPERMASHFGASGRPDAWMGKESFLRSYLLVTAFVAVLFPGMNLLLRFTPDSLINLPNKDYWLAPERRAATIERLSSFFQLFGAATLGLLLDIFHQVFLVNTGEAQALEHPIMSMVLFIGFTAVLSIAMIAGFRVKK